MRQAMIGALGVVGLLGGTALVADSGSAADHLEAPLVQDNPQTDLNDLYAFVNGENTVLIMTVNPGAGVLSPETFDPDGKYAFKIDNDGDLRPDETIRVRFGDERSGGSQRVKVRMSGRRGERATGWTGETIGLPGGGRATAGLFDDPFFFDLDAFLGTVKGTGTGNFCEVDPSDPGQDFFAGLNTSAIVVEVPTASLTDDDDWGHRRSDRWDNSDGGDDSPILNIWAETKNADGRVDRVGKPAIATVLIDDGNEDAYNLTRPRKDLKKWGDEVSANLQALSSLDGDGYDQATADFVAGLLLPDVLTLDTTSTAGFVDDPLNGRQPAEDVIDFELAVVTGLFDAGGNGPVLTTDCVDANDVPFPSGFPYLAAPHTIG